MQRADQRRQRAERRRALARRRSRLLVAEHSTDPSVWPRLLTARKCHGRQGAIGLLLGVGVQPEAIAKIVAGLPPGKR